MSVNLGLAQVSGDFLVAAIVIYSLAVIGFAGDFAFGRPRRAAAAGAAVARSPHKIFSASRTSSELS